MACFFNKQTYLLGKAVIFSWEAVCIYARCVGSPCEFMAPLSLKDLYPSPDSLWACRSPGSAPGFLSRSSSTIPWSSSLPWHPQRSWSTLRCPKSWDKGIQGTQDLPKTLQTSINPTPPSALSTFSMFLFAVLVAQQCRARALAQTLFCKQLNHPLLAGFLHSFYLGQM